MRHTAVQFTNSASLGFFLALNAVRPALIAFGEESRRSHRLLWEKGRII